MRPALALLLIAACKGGATSPLIDPARSTDRSIVIQADGTTSVQSIAELLGAVRAAPDGTELFPDIRLSSGFE